MIIVSTPYGMNQFYKLWVDAENKRNDLYTNRSSLVRGAGRDEDWKEQTIRNTSLKQFQQEFECEFLGSVNTLISPAKIKTMTYLNPIKTSGSIEMFEAPIKGHTYVCTVDVSRGVDKDYSPLLYLMLQKCLLKLLPFIKTMK